ncbi:arylsulfatase [Lewinella sp. JB7]|uniref:arylsulfatase n=1 Tax=Lewinella sp. JB7 TaxID=2962887 RepID=UPI0020C98F36|nr:arylsulfatase [Lewinella sp. JB7]MCP9235746.1 arylsulfatase [Lewinella sp. JB7]
MLFHSLRAGLHVLCFHRLQSAAITALLLLLLGSCGPAPTLDDLEDTSVPVNIVYILADDLGYGDLSCYGQQHFSTPNIDRLARRGMLFTQHYSGSTVCAPSRSSLMTGLHTGHTFIRGNKAMDPEGQYPIPDSIYTLAELLQDNGYATGAFGKWGLGPPASTGDPNNQGFTDFFGYNCQRLAHNYYPRHLWDNQQKMELPGNAGRAKEIYAPDLIHEQALAFITENRDRPFFLFYPSQLPHAELAAADSLVTMFAEQFGNETPYRGTDDGPRYREGPYESAARPHAAFAAMVTTLDQQVGQILDTLEALGLTDHTLVVFTSDNGPHLEGGADPDFFDSNGPLRGYKRDLYEGGIRVPMIASLPGRIAPGRTDHVSAFWDVFPTLAELIGVAPPDSLDGLSFLPTLEGRTADQRQHGYLYWEFHERGGRQAVRAGRWKGVRYDVFADPDGPLELYDLNQDIGETTDVADAHPDVVEELKAILRNARTPSAVFPFGAR